MELKNIFKDVDLVPTIYLTYSLGSSLNRTKIETAITDGGYNLPTNEILFYLVDTTKAFLVRYFPPLDKYGYEKLTMR